ncbi:TVP38/TMEM64 family protein [Propylenella binzhouense]|uniref:TVP38/TMEM64 family membrane protein n=1 Tax=Propylenella binzhouense TaxID=2555902 RepID=A0A964T558_9HYPH|nr:TVP38/TMEM64 family protein [Propylenella binzhouense]MYZ48355.1 TVP38/TMEM64 family protein [Propylenella binzhouense]
MATREQGKTGAGAPRRGLLRFLPILALAAALALAYALGLERWLQLDVLAEEARAFGAFVDRHPVLAPLAYVGAYAAAVAISIPGASLMTVLGGFAFGWLYGGLLTVAAATLGATTLFLAARTSLGAWLAASGGPRLQRLREGFAANAFSYLLFLRLAPVFPFWLVNLAPALFGMRLLPFVAATALGIVPGTFAYAYVGEGLEALVDAGGPLLPPKLVAAFALLALLALVPALLRRVRNRRAEEHRAASADV